MTCLKVSTFDRTLKIISLILQPQLPVFRELTHWTLEDVAAGNLGLVNVQTLISVSCGSI